MQRGAYHVPGDGDMVKRVFATVPLSKANLVISEELRAGHKAATLAERRADAEAGLRGVGVVKEGGRYSMSSARVFFSEVVGAKATVAMQCRNPARQVVTVGSVAADCACEIFRRRGQCSRSLFVRFMLGGTSLRMSAAKDYTTVKGVVGPLHAEAAFLESVQEHPSVQAESWNGAGSAAGRPSVALLPDQAALVTMGDVKAQRAAVAEQKAKKRALDAQAARGHRVGSA
eukprot:646374-Pyramimonas_sp.AAC.1